ncbi:FtsB family cell division protein [Arachidicoccus sp.]|jgi:cell division protein FtsB|uniref:FtsB family cell division protein n=1 Tax=Arachidicoccus sp. TaxID=1872624 RepID=UPI003D2447D1
MKKALKILSYLKNKYIVAVLVFLFLMFFYDRNDFFVQIQRKKELSTLEKSKAFYQSEIEKTKQELNNLESNPVSLEKYARENLFMKRDNEDVFIVDSTKSKGK